MTYCSVPFTTIYVYPDEYTTCCGNWMLPEHHVPANPARTPSEIWDSREFVSLRQNWVHQDSSSCEQCPLLATRDRHVFREGDPPPVSGWHPTRLYISNDQVCNLRCWSCREHVLGVTDAAERRESDMWALIWSFRRHLEWFQMLGSGELFASPMHMRVLQQVQPDDFPRVKIELFTNGILLPDRWVELSHLHSRVEQITMSIDACTREVYEKVRPPAKWEQLLRAMGFVKDLRDSGVVRYFQCNFVVRRINYRDVPSFVDFCKAYGATQVRFSIFDKTWMSQEDYDAEAIRDPLYHEILRDPRLDLPGVNASIIRAAAGGARIMA